MSNDGKSSFSYSTSPSNIVKVAVENDQDDREIDLKSKYKDILEMSKNLDEKYNTLILNQPKTRPAELSLLPVKFTSKNSPSPTKTSLSPSSIKLPEYQHTKKSPTRETSEDISTQRSPSHIYNPFPVRLSTRQNKDVAVKLGLYKK